MSGAAGQMEAVHCSEQRALPLPQETGDWSMWWPVCAGERTLCCECL